MKRFSLLAVVLFVVIGCARVEIERITPENPYKKGIRFYRPHPYFLVTKDREGNLQGSICWLPDKKEEYMIKVRSGIGAAETKFTLENGWNLTQFGETQDAKAPEMIDALTGTLKGVSGILDAKAMRKEEFHPGLYIFIFDEESGLIKDLRPVLQFK
jgi:hypothetical protein